ncbi:rhodanese-like domain-containing protein [Natronobeatus ordinarius]|uniref:rhodanese-like domain-containing protein n=1 Tax=Natronobeatus ordinarius TaxID=2963433 RepID=UPI0020CB8CCA|nr:rhodanese-like domain-containing protein [Natronobeatus ordinarius]
MDRDELEETLGDLPPSSKFIYKTLAHSGPMTLKALTEETMLSSRTARYGLDQLEDASLVDSSPALHDGRQTCYRLASDASGSGDGRGGRQSLVTVEWVRERLTEAERDDPGLRIVEADDEYDRGHVPGAVQIDIMNDLVDVEGCGLASRETFEAYVGERGITEESTVVIYSTEQNQFAAYLYWLFKYYRHTDVRLLDGGKNAWVQAGCPLTTEEPTVSRQEYVAQPADERIRAYRRDIEAALSRNVTIVDVRSPEEYEGKRARPSNDLPEARTAGHIPGTIHLLWSEVVDDDARFKDVTELEQLFAARDVTPDTETIVYCHVGERSALVWFVLSELLDHRDVANYDGSWIEWGNLIGAPVETDAEDE